MAVGQAGRIARNRIVIQDGDAGYGANAGAVARGGVVMNDAVLDVGIGQFAADPAASTGASSTGVVIPGKFAVSNEGVIAAQEKEAATIAG